MMRRRFSDHTPPGFPNTIDPWSAAAVDGRTRHPSRVVPASAPLHLLKSGEHNRKIGSMVTKGRWRDMPIYTLTLEERATCPRSCQHWLSCYGNAMHWPERTQHGPALERRLERELRQLQADHPAGFVVRLHVLGDFYSMDYVKLWLSWIARFPALHVYGYTARQLSDPIGQLIHEAADRFWHRFAIRLSNGGVGERGANTVRRVPAAGRVEAGIVCPVQTGRSDCCGTCGLCWGTRANIAFVVH